MTQLVGYGNEGMDLTAACQVAFLVACVYQDRRDLVEAYLADDGEIVDWSHTPLTWPPSYVVVRQGQDWHVCFAGTTNITPQLLNHIAGSFTADGTLPGGPNGQWLSVATRWNDDARPVYTGQGITRFHWSGHSYGASVADMASRIVASQPATTLSELLSIGQPRSYSGDAGPALSPGQAWQLASYGDVVVASPAWSNTLMGAVAGSTWAVWGNAVPTWRHLREPTWLGPGGQVGPGESTPSPLPDGVTIGPVAEHTMANYVARLSAAVQRYGAPPAAHAALTYAEIALAGGVVQARVPALPRVIPAPAGNVVPIYLWEGRPAEPFIPNVRLAMAYPVPINNPRPYRFTFKFNLGRWGWTESFRMNASGGVEADDEYATDQAIRDYIALRKPILSSGASIESCTVSRDDQKQDGDEEVNPSFGFGVGQATGTGSPVYLGWLFRSEDATNQVHGNMLYRGFADADIPNVSNWGRGKPIPVKVQSFQGNAKNFFTVARPAQNNVTLLGCIKTWDRNPATFSVETLRGLQVDASGYLQVITSTGFGPIPARSTLSVTVDRSPCLRGISGKWRVISSEVVEGELVITLRKKPCCSAAALASATGYVQLVNPIWVNWTGFKTITPMKRDTGGAFFAGRGRSPNKCC